MPTALTIDSQSTGAADKFLSAAELTRRLHELSPAPTDAGTLVLMVSCRDGGRRHLLDEAELTPNGGMPGDAWGRLADPHADAQLAVMQANVAELIANGQPLPLFGDNFWLDLDLSNENLPVGSRLQIGDCILEVTPLPHNGCKKFQSRFGADALRFVNDKEFRHRNLRGIYLKVVQAGIVRIDDKVRVLSR